MQDVLLALGTALVAVAISVFVAVNWQRIDAVGQGLILLGLTVALAAGTLRAARRGLGATAEAVGAATVLLAIGDVHALRVGLAPSAPPLAFWAVGLGVVAGTSWVLGQAAGIRSARALATISAQVALVVGVGSAGASHGVARSVVLVQSAVAVALLSRLRSGGPLVRRVGSTFAGLLAAAAAVGALASIFVAWVDSEFSEQRDLTGLAASVAAQLAIAACTALVVAVVHRRREALRSASLVASSTLVVFASVLVAARWGSGATFAAGALASALVLVAGRLAPEGWRNEAVVVGGSAVVLASLPLLAAASGAISSISEIARRAWTISSDAPAGSFVRDGLLRPAELGAHLAALALAVVGWTVTRPVAAEPSAEDRRRRQEGLLMALASVLVVGIMAMPVGLEITIAAVVAASLACSAGFVAVAASAPTRRIRLGAAVVALGVDLWALGWSMASSELTVIAVLTSVGLALVAVAVAHLRGDELVAGGASAWIQVSTPMAVGAVLAASGVAGAWCWSAAAAAGVVVGLVTVLLVEPDGSAPGIDGAIARCAEVAAGLVHVVALVGVVGFEDLGALAVALGAGAIALGLHAVRPDRRPIATLAVIEGIGSLWLALHLGQVAVVEAYTLPVALLLALAGMAVTRERVVGPAPSWLVWGPSLVVATAPTVVLALADGGMVRPLAGIVVGAILLVTGSVTGRRAPFDVGAACLVILGLQQSAPMVGHLPNWATIGTTGLALLAVGATFEERRRDLRIARRRYASLV